MTPYIVGAAMAVVLAALAPAIVSTRPVARPLPAMAPTRPRRVWRVVPPWLARMRAGRPTDEAVASWCEHAASRLRGGHSLAASIEAATVAVPVVDAVFGPVTHALSRGRPLTDALSVLDSDPSGPIGLVRAVLASCAELGGPAAAPLDRAAATLRARAAERAERAASSAQARLSARVLTLLPVGTLGLLALAEPTVRDALTTPAGLACVAAGLCCNVAGWWWMRRIVDDRGVA